MRMKKRMKRRCVCKLFDGKTRGDGVKYLKD